jgi:mRNA interferase RelE/StbE
MTTARIWRVEFNPDAARDLRKLGSNAERAILRYLRQRIATTDDPRRFGHALTHDLKGLWRYRVGDYRIVAEIRDDRFVVVVVTVGHRREVYD